MENPKKRNKPKKKNHYTFQSKTRRKQLTNNQAITTAGET